MEIFMVDVEITDVRRDEKLLHVHCHCSEVGSFVAFIENNRDMFGMAKWVEEKGSLALQGLLSLLCKIKDNNSHVK